MKYIFDPKKGDGVPGLPHEVTMKEAEALGMADLLKSAIENGVYVEIVKPPKVKKEKE